MRIPGWIPKGIPIPPSVKRDTVLLPALFLYNCFLFSSWLHLGHVATNPWLLLAWLYGLVGLFPLVWRDRAPRTVFATQWILAVAALPFMREYTPVAGIPVALYAVTVHYSRKTSLLALLASLIPSELGAAVILSKGHYATLAEAIEAFIPNAVFLALLAGGAWGAGRLTRANRQHIQHLEDEREYLERERETAREVEALAAERRRIARELHDIVSHAVTVILVQANGAACIADTEFTQITDAEFTQIKQSLAHIKTTGTQTMAELRRLLWVLETGDAASDAVGISELKPQPGLADLTELLTSLRDAGMSVTVQVEGTPRDLDPSVDLTAYRIVQEGLVNVLKHAGTDANPRLHLAWKPQSLLIQIDNDTNFTKGHSGQALSGGRGLVGLRERAHAAGGDLDARPRPEGGYRLSATIPVTTPGVSSVPCVSSPGREDQGKVSV
jgi:signal transduction histidine kinase